MNLRTHWIGLVIAILPSLAAAQGPATIVLDDFSYPAWGVRWTTLEFTKYTSPEMMPGENGPDGTPSVKLAMGPGEQIVITTQTEENNKWDGIRGKFPWPLLGQPKAMRASVKVVGPGDADVIFVVRDKNKKEYRTEKVTVPAGDWKEVSAKVPTMPLPASFVGVIITRAKSDQVGADNSAVLLDNLRVDAEGVAEPIIVVANRAAFERTAVAGQPDAFYVRAQSLKAKGAVDVQLSIRLQGSNQPAQTLTGELTPGPAGAAVKAFAFTPDKPGVYDVEITVSDSGRATVKRKFKLPVYRAKPLPADQLEGFEANDARLAAAEQTDQGLTSYLSNLSPATLIHSEDTRFQLFAGLPGQGLELPKYVAVPTADGVEVYKTADNPPLDKMSESWLLFFAGDAKGWDKITIVSRGKRVPAPMDLPWLVVLQRRPRSLLSEPARLVLDFGKPAGYVALMPLHGVRMLDLRVTIGWTNGLPAEEAKHASIWAKRLKRFPVFVKEDFKVDAAKDVVTIRQAFRYKTVEDDWNTKVEKFAPVSPMLAMAARNKFPVTFRADGQREVQITDGEVATAVGPACGISGADGYEYDIRGVLKYINEDRLPKTEGGGPIADELRRILREEVGKNEADTPDSRWTPGMTLREDYGIAMVGNSERHGLLGSTIPYCDEPEALWRERTLAVDARFLVNPNNFFAKIDARSGKIYTLEGFAWTRFGLSNWVDNNAYVGEMLHALEYYAKYTGDIDLIRNHWPMLRSAFGVVSDFKRHGEWELSCFDTGGGDTWDSIYNTVVSFARLADRVGDGESYRYACYYFAKHAATLPGHRQMNKFVETIPYWASLLDVARMNPDGTIGEYSVDLPRGSGSLIRMVDLAFSDVWGQNYGLRPWNETVWMRGSRSEYRMAAELTPDYAKYWLDDRVKKFAPDWYERVLVEHKVPGDAKDLRTGQPVKKSDGDYAGTVNVQARAIALGDSLEDLWAIYQLNSKGVRVSGDGRVPRICTPAALLEDGTNQPWRRLFGNGDGVVSPDWERGRDAFMDLGDESYMYGYGVAASGDGAEAQRSAGVGLSWMVFVAPGAQRGLQFGHFGPADSRVLDVKSRGVNWNTTVYTARLTEGR